MYNRGAHGTPLFTRIKAVRYGHLTHSLGREIDAALESTAEAGHVSEGMLLEARVGRGGPGGVQAVYEFDDFGVVCGESLQIHTLLLIVVHFDLHFGTDVASDGDARDHVGRGGTGDGDGDVVAAARGDAGDVECLKR